MVLAEVQPITAAERDRLELSKLIEEKTKGLSLEVAEVMENEVVMAFISSVIKRMMAEEQTDNQIVEHIRYVMKRLKEENRTDKQIVDHISHIVLENKKII